MFDKASLKLGLDKAVLQDINRKGSHNGVKDCCRGDEGLFLLTMAEEPAQPAVLFIGAGAATFKVGSGGFTEKRSIWSLNG